MAKNTTAMSRVAQQRIRDWAAQPWTRLDILSSWRVLKLRGNMDLAQINPKSGYVYTLRDLTRIDPTVIAGPGIFLSSNPMDLEEALLAIDIVNAQKYQGIKIPYVDQKIEDLRRRTSKGYGIW